MRTPIELCGWPRTRRTLLLLFAFIFVSCSHTVSAGCATRNAELDWGAVRVGGRTLLQTSNVTSNVSNNYLVLAQHRTERQDPLNNFETYRGGWDVRNKHYWASAGYTAAVGFVLAAAWLALGVALVLLVCFCCCCCRHRLRGPHEGRSLFAFLFLLLCTGAAIAGCVLVYVGQGKLHNELSDTLDYVVQESRGVVLRLRNTSTVLAGAQSIGVLQFTIPDSTKAQIQQLDSQLNNAANTLETKTNDNSKNITDVLNRVRIVMIVVAGVMLLLILLGFVFSVLGMTVLMYMLIVIVWVLVAATWILCGVFIMLNNVVGDTCVAMEQWVANPSAQTSLQDILPCVDIATSDRALNQTRSLTNDTTNGINTVVAAYLNFATPNGMPLMCNPVDTTLNAPNCVNISDAPQAWQPFECTNTAAIQSCPLGGRLTPQIYNQLNQSVTTLEGLNDNTPFLLDLANCQFVRQVFTTIQQQRCHYLRRDLKWQYIGLALISGGLMFSILFWIIFNRRRKHRFFHHVQDGDNAQFMARGTPSHQSPAKEQV